MHQFIELDISVDWVDTANMFWEPIQCSVISGAFIKAGHTGGVPAGMEFAGKFLLRERISQCSRFTHGSLNWGWREMLLRVCELPLLRINVRQSLHLHVIITFICPVILPWKGGRLCPHFKIRAVICAYSKNMYYLTIWGFHNWVDGRQMFLKRGVSVFTIICPLCV